MEATGTPWGPQEPSSKGDKSVDAVAAVGAGVVGKVARKLGENLVVSAAGRIFGGAARFIRSPFKSVARYLGQYCTRSYWRDYLGKALPRIAEAMLRAFGAGIVDYVNSRSTAPATSASTSFTPGASTAFGGSSSGSPSWGSSSTSQGAFGFR